MKRRTYGRTRVTVTLNALAVVMVGATKFHKILIKTIPFREQTLHAYPVVVARISCHDKFSGETNSKISFLGIILTPNDFFPAHPASFAHKFVSGMQSFISASPRMQYYD